jgi:two-component system KDP operon response regulator KdpE
VYPSGVTDWAETESGTGPSARVALLTSDGALAASLADDYEVTRPRSSDPGGLLEADVVLLDAAGRDLHALLRVLARHEAPPILVRDPRAAAADVRGYLDAGADAVAGASVRELRARLANLIRLGELTVSLSRREVTRAGAAVHLTPTEFSLLEVLLERPNATVDATRLMSRVWGVEASSATHYLRTYVHRLRRIIEEQPDRPRVLLTERGGYRCQAQPLEAAPVRACAEPDAAVLLDFAAPSSGALRSQLRHSGFQLVRLDDAEALATAGEPAVAASAALVSVTASTLHRIRFVRRSAAFARILLVALVEDADPQSIARALLAGADEAIAVAAPVGEIAARTRALVRLAERQQRRAPRVVRTGGLTIDRGAGRVRLDRDDVVLSRTEYRVLDALAARAGCVVRHDDLLSRVWGDACRGATQYLRVYIASLRSKLEDAGGSPRYLVNEWGVGYRLALLPAEPAG